MKENTTPSDSLVNILEAQVRFNDCDPLGIVWHGNYISYFEDGREAFGRAHGISYLDVQKAGFATPIVKSSCEHFLSLKYGDYYKIETQFINSTSAKMIFRFKIFNENGQLACSGETVQVFIDEEGTLQLYLPEFFANWKKSVGLL